MVASHGRRPSLVSVSAGSRSRWLREALTGLDQVLSACQSPLIDGPSPLDCHSYHLLTGKESRAEDTRPCSSTAPPSDHLLLPVLSAHSDAPILSEGWKWPRSIPVLLRWAALAVCALACVAFLVALVSVLSVIYLRNGDGINVQFEWSLYWRSLHSLEVDCLTRPRSSLLVSLTSLPDRLPYVDRTLKSLLLQSRCPAAILLHVPRLSRRFGVAYTLPPWLLQLNDSSRLISVHWAEKDWGPATKLLPTLLQLDAAHRPQQRVLVVDDDMLYYASTVAQYDCYAQVHPQSALGQWGCPIHRSEERPCHWGSDIRRSSQPMDFLMGTASFMVRPDFFNLTRLTAYDLPHLDSRSPPLSLDEEEWEALRVSSFYEDDSWVSLNLLLSNTSSLLIPAEHDRVAPLDSVFFYRGALSHSVNADYGHFERMEGLTAELMGGEEAATRRREHEQRWREEEDRWRSGEWDDSDLCRNAT